MNQWEEFSDGTESGFCLDLHTIRLFVLQRMGQTAWRAEMRGCLSSAPDGDFESAEIARQAIVEFAKVALDEMKGELNSLLQEKQ